MNSQDYDFLSQYLMKTSGLALGSGKEYLLEARLTPLAQSFGLANFDQLVSELRAGRDERLSSAVMETMTTNETSFFRDKTPFEEIKNVLLPSLIAARRETKSLRIWCAAASTGQEMYSIAILLREQAEKLRGLTFELLGTDISPKVLEKAEAGVYSQFEVQRGLSMQRMVKNFDKQGDLWRIKPELRAMAKFETFNLLDDFSRLGAFDVVFCRNVLIYFDGPTKRNVLERLAKLMPPDGFLFLGAAETVVGVTSAFKPVAGMRGLYSPAPVQLDASAAA